MIGVGEFTAYWSDVPVIGTKFGEPSYGAVKWAALRLTVAVCEMLLAITASWACGVPGIDASTRPARLCSGILAKSGGSWLPGTYSHGPSAERARNHRREMRTYVSCVFSSEHMNAAQLSGFAIFSLVKEFKQGHHIFVEKEGRRALRPPVGPPRGRDRGPVCQRTERGRRLRRNGL